MGRLSCFDLLKAGIPTQAQRRESVIAPAWKPGDFGCSRWLDVLSRLVHVLGHPEFERELMALINQILPIDHCVVFTYSRRVVGHLFTQGRLPQRLARRLADDYVEHFHDRDPMFQLLRRATCASSRPISLDLISDYDVAYRSHFFDRVNLIDKASMVGWCEQGGVLCNFYRMSASGRYSAAERERLGQLLPLVTEFISTHFRLAGRQPEIGAEATVPHTRGLVHSILGQRVPPFNRLTLREREVCERILVGFTSRDIALDLRIASSSVLTYRKRAYQKLGICSQNELFSLCLSAAERGHEHEH